MKYLATSIVLFFFIASTEILQAQWMQTNGPGGGVVNCFAFSGSNIFAGTDNGVYLSTNSGSSWTAVNNGLHEQVMALAVSGTNLIAGIHLDGIYLSTNNGTSWAAVTNGLPKYDWINAFTVSGTNLFAGYDLGGGISLNK